MDLRAGPGAGSEELVLDKRVNPLLWVTPLRGRPEVPWSRKDSPEQFGERSQFDDRVSLKMTFIPYGMDQMFWNPKAAVLPELQGVVAQAVLYTPAGRQEFQSRCSALFTNLLEPLPKRIEALNQTLRPLLARDGANAVQ